MHRLYEQGNSLTGEIIAAGIEVHRTLGPGLLESIYEWCMMRELELRGLKAVSQRYVVVEYKGAKKEYDLKFDILVEDCVLVEVKAVERVIPIHKAKCISNMRLLDVPVGLVMNFHEEKLVDGVSRCYLPGANK